MPPPLTSFSGQPDTSLRLVCSACGTNLIVPDSRKGASGPCPQCNNWIDASGLKIPSSSAKVLEVGIPTQGSVRRRGSATPNGGRGSIRADGFLDHGHNEKRELFDTLRVIAVFLAVSAVILFITLYMKQWMLR